jgi:hypothetical protein
VLAIPVPVRRLARRGLGRILSSQPGRHYRCTNTLSIVHTGRPTSISSAKITHATMNVVWLDGERSARFPMALPMSRHQKAAGIGSVSHSWEYARKAPDSFPLWLPEYRPARAGLVRRGSAPMKRRMKRSPASRAAGPSREPRNRPHSKRVMTINNSQLRRGWPIFPSCSLL